MDAVPCSLVDTHQHFEGTCGCLCWKSRDNVKGINIGVYCKLLTRNLHEVQRTSSGWLVSGLRFIRLAEGGYLVLPTPIIRNKSETDAILLVCRFGLYQSLWALSFPWSRDNAVGIATRLRAALSGGSNPGRARNFSRPSLGSNQILSQKVTRFSAGIKAAGA
jgi:hypothetical protein